MSSIDLAILGIVAERPQSAYEIQKDVAYHNFSRWTKISIPSVYKKVLQLKQAGYLCSDAVKGERAAEKAVYSITERGRAYFRELMHAYCARQIPLQFDCNVVVANLSKLEKPEALALLAQLRESLLASAQQSAQYAAQFSNIPLTGRTIFEQQRLVYDALLTWLDAFEAQFRQH